MAIIFTALLPDGAGQHWHTKQPHAPPLCEQMDREEMGDITRSEGAHITGGRLADRVQLGRAVTKGENRHWARVTCSEED